MFEWLERLINSCEEFICNEEVKLYMILEIFKSVLYIFYENNKLVIDFIVSFVE